MEATRYAFKGLKAPYHAVCDNPHPLGKGKAKVEARPLMSSHHMNDMKGNNLIKQSSVPMEYSQQISSLQRFVVPKSAIKKGRAIAMEEDLLAIEADCFLLLPFLQNNQNMGMPLSDITLKLQRKLQKLLDNQDHVDLMRKWSSKMSQMRILLLIR